MGDQGPATPSGRGVPAAIAAVVGLSLLLVVAALLLAARSKDASPATYPPGSPEARFAAYVAAIDKGDTATAYQMMSESYRRQVTSVRFGSLYATRGPITNSRIAIRDSRVEGDRAFLTFAVTTFYDSGGFDAGESTHEGKAALVREGGDWRFEQPPNL